MNGTNYDYSPNLAHYGLPPKYFGVVSPTRAQLARAESDASFRNAAANQKRIMQEAKQYRIKNNLPKFNALFPPRRPSRTRSKPLSRTPSRTRAKSSRKRSH